MSLLFTFPWYANFPLSINVHKNGAAETHFLTMEDNICLFWR